MKTPSYMDTYSSEFQKSISSSQQEQRTEDKKPNLAYRAIKTEWSFSIWSLPRANKKPVFILLTTETDLTERSRTFSGFAAQPHLSFLRPSDHVIVTNPVESNSRTACRFLLLLRTLLENRKNDWSA